LDAPGAISKGEYRFYFSPDLKSPRLNWKRNEGALRQVMSWGNPIRDASVDASGNLIELPQEHNYFLRAERNLLRSKGWKYNPADRMWHPPVTEIP
jgi:hypothetical protein